MKLKDRLKIIYVTAVVCLKTNCLLNYRAPLLNVPIKLFP